MAPPSERLRRAGSISWAVVGIAALVVLLGILAWFVRIIWPPLILAGAIVFLLNPVVTVFHGRGVPRALATGLTYLACFGVLGMAGLIIVPLGADQAEELSDELPQVRRDVERWINDRAEQSEGWFIQIPSVQAIEDEVEAETEETPVQDTFDRVRDIGGRVFHVLIVMVLAPIIAFYLLVDLPRLRQVVESLIPMRMRPEALVIGRRLGRAIGGFFRGQLMVALIVGLITSIGLAIIDLPFWLIVGMVAGLFNIIPLIGPWVGAVPGILIALTTRDVGTALWVAAIMAGTQQVDNHFISPLVMQRAVHLHPAAVMLALLAGGTLGGFFGLLLAVPAAAVLKIVIGHVWRTYVLGEPIEELVAEQEAADAEPAVGPVEDVLDRDGATKSDSTPKEGEPIEV